MKSRSNREVAIKVLAAAIAAVRERLARFERKFPNSISPDAKWLLCTRLGEKTG